MRSSLHIAVAPWALLWFMLGALPACAHAGGTVAEGLETPSYSTIRAEGPFSLRRYAPYVVGQTVVDEPDMDKASRAGFRRLAGYIFGGNQGKREIAMTAPVTAERSQGRPEGEKIAMTAPVGAEPAGEGWRITFMMPGRYDLDTLPIPQDPRVTFARVPAQCRAVVTFSWLTTDERVAEHTDALRAWAKASGLEVRGAAVLARYNDPFTLPWNRTNEIWMEVGGEACGTS